ncbi:MAG: preprotein translocase subunit SecA [Dehalococcoidia bacterium]|nr:preprotein translocase subunit SecA [Dehalococcoidia bacterium]
MLKWLGNLRDSNEREVNKLRPIIEKINALDQAFQKLSDDELKAKTAEFKKRLAAATAEEYEAIEEARKELANEQGCTLAEMTTEDKEALSQRCQAIQEEIDSLDKELRKKENAFLDELLPEAFASVREAARRSLGQRHFDMQLMGGIVLHQGKIAEMKTGEGKTLVATLPLYLNAITGRGVHLVTVNDYLARRDPYWMGPVFHALGMSVASIYPMQNPAEQQPARLYDPDYTSDKEHDPWAHFRPIRRREAYLADVTYGTSAEFGFDYLRDNMALDLNQCVQRMQSYAIVDEVDNLLIDEARTPLIISAPDMESSQKYQVFARLVQSLKPSTDYEAKEKERSVEPTDDGFGRIEGLLRREGLLKGENLYDPHNTDLMRHLRNALSAKEFFRRDREYVVKDGEIIIVDEFTGRLMLGRRYSEGLHQAIEAKEHVKVQHETKTFATITIQNYFRMYPKLAGMTGTAATEAEEFAKIYKLEVVQIPTSKPLARQDLGDLIYKNEDSKFKAIANEVQRAHSIGQPVLIGTVSIEKSEALSDLLTRRGVKHNVLNAKKHEQEALIVAEAGLPGAVTVATNMAGRGVDIILGGKPPEDDNEKERTDWQVRHDKVLAMGGLYVVGTERHEARRIDNQLRGRAGRQGDPGTSRFYVALDDDVMRRFGGERIQGIMNWAGMDENTPIENRLITRSIENAQTRVEGYHFDARKHLVDYDDVINKQREVIYRERRKILSGADLRSNILAMVRQEIEEAVVEHTSAPGGEGPDYAALVRHISGLFPPNVAINDFGAETLSRQTPSEITESLVRVANTLYEQKEKEYGAEGMRVLERLVMLRVIDTLWVEHLTAIDYLRQGIGMQAVAQQDPLVAYRRQSSEMFQELMDTIREDVAHTIFKVSLVKKEMPGAKPATVSALSSSSGQTARSAPVPALSSPMSKVVGQPGKKQVLPQAGKKVGRNELCPCGSGKKYKLCCGR